MLSDTAVVAFERIFEGNTIHTFPLHEPESSALENQDLSRLMSHVRLKDSDVFIRCRLKYLNNQNIWKYQLKEQNNELSLKSGQRDQDEELTGTYEQQHNIDFISISEQTEQNNKLIGESEHNIDRILKCGHKEQAIAFILKSEPKTQSTEHILQSEHNESNYELFEKCQQEEQNYTCKLNCFWCRGSQKGTKTSKHNCNSGVSFSLLFIKVSPVQYCHTLLNELGACEYYCLLHVMKIVVTHTTSFSSDDESRLSLKLPVIVWLQLLQKLSPIAASLDEDSRLNPKESFAALKSDMHQLMVSSMNIHKTFISVCKNSMCVILGKSNLNKIRRNCLYQSENTADEHNKTVMCLKEIIFLNVAQIFFKENVRFCPAQRSCSNRHHVNINGVASCGHKKGAKYDVFIFIYIINNYSLYKCSRCSSTLDTEWSNIAAKADAASMTADPNSTETDSNAGRLRAWSSNTGGMISICLISIVSIASRSTSTRSMEDKNCLGKPLLHCDVINIRITMIVFCTACYGYQVTIFCCRREVKRLFLNDKHPNKRKQFSYFLCHHQEHVFRHITSKCNINTLFQHSDCHKRKERRFNKLLHSRIRGKQHGYRNSISIIGVLFTEMSLETFIIHFDVNCNHQNSPVDHQEPCWKYPWKPCHAHGKECSNLRPQLGNTRSTNFPKKKMNVQMLPSTHKNYFTRTDTSKDVTSCDGTLEYPVLTFTKNERTETIAVKQTELQILQKHEQSSIWIIMFSYIRSSLYPQTRRTFVETDGSQNKHIIIKSGRIKGRQAMISGNGRDFNQNASNDEVSEQRKKSAKSVASSSALHTEDADDEESGTSDDEEDELTAKSNRIKSNIECMDNFLIVWHSGFLIMFLFLLGVGIVLRVYFSTIIERSVKSSANYVLYSHFVKIENVPDKLEFGNLTEVLGESLIILSSLYIACVLCYMTFLIHRITFTIPLVVIVTGAVVLTEVNIINIYMSPVSAANEEAKKELKERAEKEYAVDSNKPFSVTYDLISIWGHCCGIVDQYDFQNVMLKYFLPAKSEHKTLQVPPTCCQPSYFEKGVEDVVDCASTAEGIFNVGCYQTIYIWLRMYCNLYSIVVILQLLDLCIHIILYKKHLSLLTLEETHVQKLQQQATID